MPLVKTGKVKALAVTSSKRIDALPNVPTVAEAGFADFEDYTWVGVFGPQKLPTEIVVKLNAAINDVLKSPSFKEKLDAAGFEAQPGTPQNFSDYLKREVVKWGRIVKETGVTAQ